MPESPTPVIKKDMKVTVQLGVVIALVLGIVTATSQLVTTKKDIDRRLDETVTEVVFRLWIEAAERKNPTIDLPSLDSIK